MKMSEVKEARMLLDNAALYWLWKQGMEWLKVESEIWFGFQILYQSTSTFW